MTISPSKLGLHNTASNREHNIRVALIADKLSDAFVKVDASVLDKIKEVIDSKSIHPKKRNSLPDTMKNQDGGYHLQHDYLGRILDYLDEHKPEPKKQALSKSDQNNSPNQEQSASEANIEEIVPYDAQKVIDTISKHQSPIVSKEDAQLIKDISEILGINSVAVQAYSSFVELFNQKHQEHNAAHSAELPKKIDEKLATALPESILLKNQSYNALKPSNQSDSFFHALGKTREQAIESLRIFLNIGNKDTKYTSIIRKIYGQFLTDKNNEPQSQELLKIAEKLKEDSGIFDSSSLENLLKALEDRKEPKKGEEYSKQYLELSRKAVNLKTVLQNFLNEHWKNSNRMVDLQGAENSLDADPIASAIAAYYDAKINVHTRNAGEAQTINAGGTKEIHLLHADINGESTTPNHFLRLIPEPVAPVTSSGTK